MHLQNTGIAECPDIDFIYDDADTHANEIAEFYSYTEQNEFQLNVKVKYYNINCTSGRETIILKIHWHTFVGI